LTGDGTSVAGEAANAEESQANKDDSLVEAIEKFKKDSKDWVESIDRG
jgi:hypothetical protein